MYRMRGASALIFAKMRTHALSTKFKMKINLICTINKNLILDIQNNKNIANFKNS